MRSRQRREGTVSARTLPGDLLLSPTALAAIVLLVVNDWLLKGWAPGVFTGKLSDVAGLYFFPLLLVALVELIYFALRRGDWAASKGTGLACVIATGVVFTAIKTWSPAGDAYGVLLGWLQWPVRAISDLVTRGTVGGPRLITLAEDRTDLLALPVLLGSYLAARSSCRGQQRASQAQDADVKSGQVDDRGLAEETALE